jgi:8-oxo-dGTP diphosphatase
MPSVATDIAVFTCVGPDVHVLLIERGDIPYKAQLALPGGFLYPDEDLDNCAKRVLKTKTGLPEVNARHFTNFSDPARDERWVISAAYFALLPMPNGLQKADTGKDTPKLVPLQQARRDKLAFDHNKILEAGIAAVARRLWDPPIACDLIRLLPEKFTLSQFQGLHEAFEDDEIDRGNFRRKLKSSGILTLMENLEQTERDIADDPTPANRPSTLYGLHPHYKSRLKELMKSYKT